MRLISVLAAVLTLSGLLRCEGASAGMDGIPRLMLWAWERPEDLRSLDPAQAGVAYLAWTFRLKGSDIDPVPRRQPLLIPAGTVLVAVSRIEVDRGAAFSGTTEQRERIVDTLLGSLSPSARGIQIDFDARVSERGFYRDLLRELRRRMDPAMPLTMTSLASWALFDDWIRDLPVDEAVPMVFMMGADAAAVRAWIDAGKDFRPAIARRATGVCLEEPLHRLPGSVGERRRVYVFTLRPWTAKSLSRAMEAFL